MKFLTPEVRAWIYRILVAVGALVAGYGFISGEQLALWLGVVTALLNIMPTGFTSTKHDVPADTES